VRTGNDDGSGGGCCCCCCCQCCRSRLLISLLATSSPQLFFFFSGWALHADGRSNMQKGLAGKGSHRSCRFLAGTMNQPTKFRTHSHTHKSVTLFPSVRCFSVFSLTQKPARYYFTSQNRHQIISNRAAPAPAAVSIERSLERRKKEERERGRPGWWRSMGCCVVGEWPSSFSRNGEAVPLDAECVCVCAGESERRAEGGGGGGGGEGRARAQQQKRLQHYTTLVSVLPTY
jgi:hypothetical protein